jgi:pyruvate/2-oxoglutarate dehydrogenase complex dihydrolipoamide dehydrogenase (E3) component
MIEDYDVIVIGGRPGGEVAAERCSHAGLSSTAIENYDSLEEGQ